METNESILVREIVSIDDRKKLGKMKDLCVDCDTYAVSHFIFNNAATGSPVALPFDKSLAIGDTFMTILSRDDVLSPADTGAKAIIDDGFRVVGVEVFSKAGNRLGVVESYEFDPTYGLVTRIILGKRKSYTTDEFLFFSPDFIFVDDGQPTQQDVRSGKKPKAKKKSTVKVAYKPRRKAGIPLAEKKEMAGDPTATPENRATPQVIVASNTDDSHGKKAAALSTDGDQKEKSVVSNTDGKVEHVAKKAEKSDEDAALIAFLTGATVNEDVKSGNGEFSVSRGTTLTEELVHLAQKHDALLLLTMCVDE
jgi:sporulation protein YlmC with PRC-barrel domain